MTDKNISLKDLKALATNYKTIENPSIDDFIEFVTNYINVVEEVTKKQDYYFKDVGEVVHLNYKGIYQEIKPKEDTNGD